MKDTPLEVDPVTRPATRRPAAIHVRLDRLDAALEAALGAGAGDATKAGFLGISYLAMWRMRKVGHRPSQELIASILNAPWPAKRRPLKFEDLFWVQDAPIPTPSDTKTD